MSLLPKRKQLYKQSNAPTRRSVRKLNRNNFLDLEAELKENRHAIRDSQEDEEVGENSYDLNDPMIDNTDFLEEQYDNPYAEEELQLRPSKGKVRDLLKKVNNNYSAYQRELA